MPICFETIFGSEKFLTIVKTIYKIAKPIAIVVLPETAQNIAQGITNSTVHKTGKRSTKAIIKAHK